MGGDEPEWWWIFIPSSEADLSKLDAAKGASLLSRGAAAECSPGQRPGIRCVLKMSHGVAKEGLGIFRTYRCSCLPHAQPRALPGATLCRRSAALVGRRLMRNYFGQHCLRGGDKNPPPFRFISFFRYRDCAVVCGFCRVR